MRRFAILILVGCAIAGTGYAADRQGLLLGFSIGGGRIDCLGCEGRGAGAIDLRIGRSIGQRFAALASMEGTVRGDAQGTFGSYSLTGVGQYWISNRVWMGAGMGFGENDLEVGLGGVDPEGGGLLRFTIHSGNSFAVNAQGGVELWQRGRFALDLRSRYTRLTRFQTDNFSISAGFTWY